jgi:alpha-mannosidase
VRGGESGGSIPTTVTHEKALPMIQVHLIFNAHLDPIWLWPWQAGLDEVLATCRSACERLEAHPDLTFCRGEAWVYRWVERLDPALYARIQALIAQGRWEPVGGWWIQPDCNQPSGFAMERQVELGKRYFEEHLGGMPEVAFNVDSFGHAAFLPGLMRRHGQRFYCFQRPSPHEKSLPANLFRWRGSEADGPEGEVLCYRIPVSYTAWTMDIRRVEAAVRNVPPGIEHTMCFVGVGDHGGGPTERLIDWCRKHQHAIPGAELVFSTPSRFFKAIEAQAADLPLVTGELQHHAVGCYSVHRGVKLGLRKAEHLLAQAETADPSATDVLTPAWEKVCFHHFHDTLGGTCLPSAYPQVEADLGYARSVADETVHAALRRRYASLPDDPLQRLVFMNASDSPFSGYVECEPWTELPEATTRGWRENYRLLDESGTEVPYQRMATEALAIFDTPRLLVRLEAEPGAVRVLRLERGGRTTAELPAANSVQVAGGPRLHSNSGAAFDPLAGTITLLGSTVLPVPRLALITDNSDTWSHNIDRYDEGPAESARWEEPALVDRGPLMASVVQTGRIGESRLWSEWRVYADEPFVEWVLRVTWLETHRVLKLVLPLADSPKTRTDGVMGGTVERANDGVERPLRDLTVAGEIGIVCPEVYALDGTPERLRLTLLRAATLAHHLPHMGTGPRARISDQGEHEFRFRFFPAAESTLETLESHAKMLQRPLTFGDLTRGMPPAPLED